MLDNGVWIATHPNRSEYHRSFSLNSLYSPLGWVSWEKIVREFLEAKHAPANKKLQVWVNTRMGLTFEAAGERPEWITLKNRSEPYQILTVPQGGLFLTAGVDIQDDRFAIEILAWGRGEECWIIYWGELYADTSNPRAWTELNDFLSRDFNHFSGISLKIHCTAIDSGYRTNEVYDYVRQHSPGVIAVKGSSTAAQPVIGHPSFQDIDYHGTVIKRGVQLWPVGTDTAKSTIYARLKITEPGPRYIHFPLGLDDSYYRQLTAEKYVERYDKNGKPKRDWILPSGKRNEALDVTVYALAAAVRSGLERMNWTKLESIINYKSAVPIPAADTNDNKTPTTSAPKTTHNHRRVKRSNYMSTGVYRGAL
jgi:phage terminase large subunit GpA-like protein